MCHTHNQRMCAIASTNTDLFTDRQHKPPMNIIISMVLTIHVEKILKIYSVEEEIFVINFNCFELYIRIFW